MNDLRILLVQGTLTGIVCSSKLFIINGPSISLTELTEIPLSSISSNVSLVKLLTRPYVINHRQQRIINIPTSRKRIWRKQPSITASWKRYPLRNMTIYQSLWKQFSHRLNSNENYSIGLIRCYADGNKSRDAWDVVEELKSRGIQLRRLNSSCIVYWSTCEETFRSHHN